MNIVLFDFDHDISISSDWISVLEIENKRLFSSYSRSIYNLTNNLKAEHSILIYDNDIELKFDKVAFYIIDPLMLDFNSKYILNALQKKVQEVSVSEDILWSESERVFSELNIIISSILSELETDVEINTQWDVQRLFKIFGIKIIQNDDDTHLQKLLNYIEVVSNLKLYKIIFIANLKTYLDEDEILEFYKFVMYKKIPILLLESNIQEKIIKYENKLSIDAEFDEFVTNYK